MQNILEWLSVISAFLLIAAVLMHAAKGEGLGSIGGSAQMFRSASGVERGLNLFTWVVAITFLLSCALLGWGLVK